MPHAPIWLAAALLLACWTAGCGGADGTAERATAGDGRSPVAESTAAESTVAESTAAPTPAGAGTDLLLITIDTLRADSLGFAGNQRVETPVLDRLAAAGRTFDQAHAHNVVTLPSHANILTGLYPYQHGVRENSGFVLGDDVPTLATLLSEAGYATGAFVAAFPLDARYGLARGFSVYDDNFLVGSRPTDFKMPERRGDEVVGPALAWWRQQAGGKRFLWLHLYDPHSPYAPPQPFADRYADQPYLGEIAATDSYLAPLLTPFLDGQEEPALVIVTSDHGEALGDHGEETHGLFAYEATLKVPLVLWGAGVKPGVDRRWAGHVDLLPTALDALGLAAALPDGLPGSSLLAPEHADALPERELYFEALTAYLNRGWAPLYGLLQPPHKYIHLPLPELYQLEEDPAEQVNLIDDQRRLFAALRGRLPEAATRPPQRGEISPEEARKLAALGYIAGSGPLADSFTEADDPKNLLDLDRKLQDVIALYTRGQLTEAAALGREIVAARPKMAVGYERLATVLREAGDSSEAITVLQRALSHGLDHPALLRQLGLALAETGRGAEAVVALEPLAGSDDLESLNALGVAYYSAGRLREAATALDRVLAADPDNAKALETFGAVALAGGRPELARQRLETAVDRNPELPIAWNSLGVAYQLLGDSEAALAAWRRAGELDPRLLDAFYNRGLTAAGMGRAAEAREALEHYLATAPAGTPAADLARAREVLTRLGASR